MRATSPCLLQERKSLGAGMGEEITPRCLPARDAARYVGISETAFRTVVAKSVRPVYMSPKRPVWLRDQLDEWINQRAGIETSSTSDDLMDAISGS